jgi:hypothetical protein
MMDLIDPERYEAFEQLLTKPDPPDLPRRGHVLHCAGDPDRRATRLPPIQMVWLQRWCLDACGEEDLPAPARRRGPSAFERTANSAAAVAAPRMTSANAAG